MALQAVPFRGSWTGLEACMSTQQIRELESKLRQARKAEKKRKRARLGLPAKRKGMGCRDRDEALKAERGYTDPSTYVRKDGSEKLVGADWIKRKSELAMRSLGQCEWWDFKCSENQVGPMRCSSAATEPHHIIKRSVRRDDRLSNLQGLCHFHHVLLDPRKLRSGKVGG
jgi:hypothetical protein